MSQLESWDPKPGTQFGGPFRAIPTSVPGVRVCELLPKTAKQMHHLAIVRSLCTKDNSHSAGVARIQRGDPILLIERLAHRLRGATTPDEVMEKELAAMAADPQIRRELAAISNEFAGSESDGLENL